jgi:hypothetical protein
MLLLPMVAPGVPGCFSGSSRLILICRVFSFFLIYVFCELFYDPSYKNQLNEHVNASLQLKFTTQYLQHGLTLMSHHQDIGYV